MARAPTNSDDAVPTTTLPRHRASALTVASRSVTGTDVGACWRITPRCVLVTTTPASWATKATAALAMVSMVPSAATTRREISRVVTLLLESLATVLIAMTVLFGVEAGTSQRSEVPPVALTTPAIDAVVTTLVIPISSVTLAVATMAVPAGTVVSGLAAS